MFYYIIRVIGLSLIDQSLLFLFLCADQIIAICFFLFVQVPTSLLSRHVLLSARFTLLCCVFVPQGELRVASGTITNLQTQRDDLLRQLRERDERLEEARLEARQLASQFASVAARADGLSHDNSRLQADVATANATVSQLQDRLAESLAHDRQWQAKHASLQSRLDGANARGSELEAAVAAEQKRVGQEQAKVTELTSRIAALNLELESARWATLRCLCMDCVCRWY